MLKLRPIGPSDQAVLWELLLVALWDPPPAGPRPREILQHPGVRIYAEEWGRPGDVGVIGERQGHGERLMRAALAAAGAHGYRQVALTVHPLNPAIALYERVGFEKREMRNSYHLMIRTCA